MRHTILAMLLVLLLPGCGGESRKPTVITPVDGIKQNIDIGEDLKKSVRDSAGANAATEAELKKKK